MDFLKQTKLTKEEWSHIEIPIQDKKEESILDLIKNGYNIPNITWTNKVCLRDYLKIKSIYDNIIFDTFISQYLQKINNLPLNIECNNKDNQKLRTSDMIKMQN